MPFVNVIVASAFAGASVLGPLMNDAEGGSGRRDRTSDISAASLGETVILAGRSKCRPVDPGYGQFGGYGQGGPYGGFGQYGGFGPYSGFGQMPGFGQIPGYPCPSPGYGYPGQQGPYPIGGFGPPMPPGGGFGQPMYPGPGAMYYGR
jgi:hypothetical protein